MIVIVKFSRKICGITLVTEKIWGDIAAWSTAKSALKGWSVRWRKGFRLTTPWIGVGLSLVVGRGE